MAMAIQPSTKTLSPRPQAPARSPQRANQPPRYLHLVLEPHGFEGLLRLGECAEAEDLPVPELEHPANSGRCAIYPAAPAAIVDATHQQSDVTYPEGVVHFCRSDLPGICEIAHVAPRPVMAAIHASLAQREEGVPLHLGIGECDKPLCVPRPKRVKHRPSEFHVLLRNK